MNERIKELRNQAWKLVSEEERANGKLYEAREQWERCDEKFAELIVRECARAVDKVYEDAEPDHGCYDWATFAEGADVLKHFGVDK